jgi:hypothetical protein
MALAPNTPQDASAAAQQCLSQAPDGGVFTVTAAGSSQTATSTGTQASVPGSSTQTSGAAASTSAAAGNAAISLSPVHLGSLGAVVGAIAFGALLI